MKQVTCVRGTSIKKTYFAKTDTKCETALKDPKPVEFKENTCIKAKDTAKPVKKATKVLAFKLDAKKLPPKKGKDATFLKAGAAAALAMIATQF